MVCAGVFVEGHCGPECLPNLIRILKPNCYLVATVKHQLYASEQKIEWKKQITDCECDLVEENEMPYRDGAGGIVIVVHKTVSTVKE